jgi:hypothetical protein
MKKIILIFLLANTTCHSMEQRKQKIQHVKHLVNAGTTLLAVATTLAGAALTYGYCQPTNGEFNQCVQQGLGASVATAAYVSWQLEKILLRRWRIREIENEITALAQTSARATVRH